VKKIINIELKSEIDQLF